MCFFTFVRFLNRNYNLIKLCLVYQSFTSFNYFINNKLYRKIRGYYLYYVYIPRFYAYIIHVLRASAVQQRCYYNLLISLKRKIGTKMW